MPHWLARILLVGCALICLCLGSAWIWLQLPATKAKITQLLTQQLSEATHLQISMQPLKGILPFTARSEELLITEQGRPVVRIEGLALTWHLIDLLRGRLTFESVAAQKVEIAANGSTNSGEAFPWPEVPITTQIKNLQIKQLTLENSALPPLALQGSLLFEKNSKNFQTRLRCSSPLYPEAKLKIRIRGNGANRQLHVALNGSAEELTLRGAVILAQSGEFIDSALSVTLPTSRTWKNLPEWLKEFKTTKAALTLSGTVSQPRLVMQAANAQVKTKAGILTHNKLTLSATPTLHGVEGALQLSAQLDAQPLSIISTYHYANHNLTLSELHSSLAYADYQAQLQGSAQLLFPENQPSPHITSTLHLKLQKQQAEILETQLYLSGSFEELNWTAATHGLYDLPFQLDATGRFHNSSDSLSVTLATLSGTVASFPLNLSHPTTLQLVHGEFALTPAHLTVQDGSLQLETRLSPASASLHADFDKFPLELCALAHTSLRTTGTLSGSLVLDGAPSHPNGTANLNLELVDETSAPFSATAQLALENQQLAFKIQGYHATAQTLALSGKMPFLFSLSPLSLEIPTKGALAASLSLDSSIKQLLNPFFSEEIDLDGHLQGTFVVSGNISDPFIEGELELTNGHYINSETKLKIQDISFALRGSRHEMFIDQILATDGHDGTLAGNGRILLNRHARFPFHLTLDIHRMAFLQLDEATASFDGMVTLSGTTEAASLQGELTLHEGHFQIPDRAVVTVPNLHAVYINAPEIQKASQTTESGFAIPIGLNIRLDIPQTASIQGRGLVSQWKGFLSVQGSIEKPAVTGALNMEEGSFTFANKKFTLTHGVVTFSGKGRDAIALSISGSISVEGATIIASLEGPVDHLALTLQALPAMPTDEILSRLLFNSSVSEISPIQAVQLGQAFLSLSGESSASRLFEQFQRNTGIDRIDISSPSGDWNDVNIKAGKYVIDGVFVGVSKSVNAEDTTINVEADITRDLKAEANFGVYEESTFGVKWEHDY